MRYSTALIAHTKVDAGRVLPDRTIRRNLNSPAEDRPGVVLRLLQLGGSAGGRAASSVALLLGLTEPIALALDGDDVGVVDDAVDERGGAGRVGEDRGPVVEGEIRGEHKALLLVAPAHHLEEQIGVAVIEGEVSYLIDDEQADLGIVLEPIVQRPCRLLRPEVEQELGCGEELD